VISPTGQRRALQDRRTEQTWKARAEQCAFIGCFRHGSGKRTRRCIDTWREIQQCPADPPNRPEPLCQQDCSIYNPDGHLQLSKKTEMACQSTVMTETRPRPAFAFGSVATNGAGSQILTPSGLKELRTGPALADAGHPDRYNRKPTSSSSMKHDFVRHRQPRTAHALTSIRAH